ncbi:uncharacterized protein LOC126780514 isoform X1 [Nymphalis io]|uniref:uncharacterized protein LOC126780514 isoform X1 n=1 Tax=Inachis io TaxID=171585 RepID=UPI00216831F2|nr:uncharacterized protein LOC126780514 isoform X1 [Nymphalis io]
MKRGGLILITCLLQTVLGVKVKVIMHSDQEDSRVEEDETQTESWDSRKKVEITMLPFLKKSHRAKQIDFEDEKLTEKPKQMHPNEMLFPLIYRQNHINSMFKFGENWYTWSTEKRTDGSKAVNYYICYDEPKHCDEIGWERTDTIPKCAFQIEALTPDDRACINGFGVESHTNSACDGGEQMKVSEIVRSCGPRIRSLWRFIRVGRRPTSAVKPADVNSLVCEDEDECYLSVEYRIHHDRITFSLHEPSRGQTFKSALKRDIMSEDNKATVIESHTKSAHRGKKVEITKNKKNHMRTRKVAEGKGVVKERDNSEYTNRRQEKNKIKIREDISEDVSE